MIPPTKRRTLLRATSSLAIASKTLSPLFPDLPTMIEAGVPEQFAAFVKAEADRWGKLVKAADIKPHNGRRPGRLRPAGR